MGTATNSPPSLAEKQLLSLKRIGWLYPIFRDPHFYHALLGTLFPVRNSLIIDESSRPKALAESRAMLRKSRWPVVQWQDTGLWSLEWRFESSPASQLFPRHRHPQSWRKLPSRGHYLFLDPAFGSQRRAEITPVLKPKMARLPKKRPCSTFMHWSMTTWRPASRALFAAS